MRGANTENAQVRARGSAEQIASESDRLLNDPAFKHAYNLMREAYVSALEKAQSDGSPEFADYILDIASSLRNLSALKRALALTIQRQQFQMAQYEQTEGHLNG